MNICSSKEYYVSSQVLVPVPVLLLVLGLVLLLVLVLVCEGHVLKL